MIILQERDREILKFCYEQQFITIEHVMLGFFEGRYKDASRRLGQLAQAKFLKEEDSGFLVSKQKFYRLTKLGRHAAESSCANFIPQKRFLAHSTLMHDSFVSLVRIRLSELWDATWIPESAAKKYELSEVPDGIVLFESGKQVAIEVENSIKGRQRFESRLHAWKNTQITLVLYIATSEALDSTLRSYLKSAPAKPHFGLTTWERLKSSTPVLWSPNGSIQAFTRKKL